MLLGLSISKIANQVFMSATSKFSKISTSTYASSSISSGIISSLSNEKIKLIRNLEESSQARSKKHLVKLEGHRQILDAIKNGLIPHVILYTERAITSIEKNDKIDKTIKTTTENVHHELSQIILNFSKASSSSQNNVSVSQVSDDVMKTLVDTVNNQGVVAAFQKPIRSSNQTSNYLTDIYRSKLQSLAKKICENNQLQRQQSSTNNDIDTESQLLILVLDGVADPGNMGSLIRTAVALQVDGIVVVKSGSCDIWAPKVVRSAMGLILQTNIIEIDDWYQLKDIVQSFNSYLLQQQQQQQQMHTNENTNTKVKVFYTDCNEVSQSYYHVNFTQHSMIVIGSEANGISHVAHQLGKKEEALKAEYIHIPMSSSVESLNAAVAGSIVLSEVLRQRRTNRFL